MKAAIFAVRPPRTNRELIQVAASLGFRDPRAQWRESAGRVVIKNDRGTLELFLQSYSLRLSFKPGARPDAGGEKSALAVLDLLSDGHRDVLLPLSPSTSTVALQTKPALFALRYDGNAQPRSEGRGIALEEEIRVRKLKVLRSRLRVELDGDGRVDRLFLFHQRYEDAPIEMPALVSAQSVGDTFRSSFAAGAANISADSLNVDGPFYLLTPPHRGQPVIFPVYNLFYALNDVPGVSFALAFDNAKRAWLEPFAHEFDQRLPEVNQ